MSRVLGRFLESALTTALLSGCIHEELRVGRGCPAGAPGCLDAGADAAAEDMDASVGAAMEASAPPLGTDAAVTGSAAALRCIPGYYRGRYYVPNYLPAAAGLCGWFTLFGGEGSGEWRFVVPDTPAINGRRPIHSCLSFTVEQSDGGVPPGSMSMTLSGEVDCVTGALSGQLQGVYRSISVCDSQNEQEFSVKGHMSATYDVARNMFVNGEVQLHEPPPPLPLSEPPGGEGTWEAAFESDAATAPPTEGCLGDATFVDFDVP